MSRELWRIVKSEQQRWKVVGWLRASLASEGEAFAFAPRPGFAPVYQPIDCPIGKSELSISALSHYEGKFRDALNQLQRYGEPDRYIVDIVSLFTDVNDDVQHGRDVSEIFLLLEAIKLRIDEYAAVLNEGKL